MGEHSPSPPPPPPPPLPLPLPCPPPRRPPPLPHPVPPKDARAQRESGAESNCCPPSEIPWKRYYTSQKQNGCVIGLGFWVFGFGFWVFWPGISESQSESLLPAAHTHTLRHAEAYAHIQGQRRRRRAHRTLCFVLAIRSCSRPLGRGEREEEEEEAAEEKEEQAEQAVDFWKGSRISSNLKAGRQASQWKGIESNQIEWKETEWNERRRRWRRSSKSGEFKFDYEQKIAVVIGLQPDHRHRHCYSSSSFSSSSSIPTASWLGSGNTGNPKSGPCGWPHTHTRAQRRARSGRGGDGGGGGDGDGGEGGGGVRFGWFVSFVFSFPPSSSSYFLVAIIIICWCLHNPTSLPLPRGPTLATLHRHRHRPASSVTSLFGPPKSVPSNGCGHRLILPTGQLDVCITVNGVQPPECPRERPSRERAPPDARGIGIEMGIVMGMEMPGMTTHRIGWM